MNDSNRTMSMSRIRDHTLTCKCMAIKTWWDGYTESCHTQHEQPNIDPITG